MSKMLEETRQQPEALSNTLEDGAVRPNCAALSEVPRATRITSRGRLASRRLRSSRNRTAPSSSVFDSASGCWRVSSSIFDMVLKSQSEPSEGSMSSTERLRSCCGQFVTATERYYFHRVRRRLTSTPLLRAGWNSGLEAAGKEREGS